MNNGLLQSLWRLLLLSILSLFIYGFIATPYGVKTLLWYAQKEGILIQTTGVSGSLLHGARFNNLHYEDEEVIVDASDVTIPLKFLPLIWSRIALDALKADTLHLILKDPNPFQNIAPLIRLSRNHPISAQISFYDLDIQHMTLQIVPDAPITLLGHVQLDAYTKANEVHVERLVLSNSLYQVDAKGVLDQVNIPELKIAGDWELFTQTPVSGHLEAVGSLEQLQLTQDLSAPITAQITGDLYDLDTKPAWHLTMPYALPLTYEPIKGNIDGTLTLQGALREIQIFSSQLTIENPSKTTVFSGDLLATYDFEQWTLEKLNVTDKKYEGFLSLKGSYAPKTDNLTLTGHAEKFRWPLTHTATDWEIDIAQKTQQWEIKQLSAKWPSGLLTVSGQINTLNPQKTKLHWALNAEQLADIIPQLTGSIHSEGALTINEKGDLYNPTVQALFNAKKLSYRHLNLDALQLTIKGSLENHHANIFAHNKQKKYELAIKGQLDDQLNWQGDVDSASIEFNPHQRFNLRGFARATLESGEFAGELLVNLANKSFIRANINLPDLGNRSLLELEQQKITALLQAHLTTPEVLELFSPELTDLQGPVQAKVEITQTLANPLVQVDMTWKKGKIDIPRLGISLENINVSAQSDAHGAIHFKGSLQADKGKLNIVGKSEPWQESRLTEFTLTGDHATLIDTNKYHVLASPDLRLTLLGSALTVEGRIDVPEAMIKPRGNDDAIQPSEDIIIVSAKQDTPFIPPVTVTSHVLLRLGDNVYFDSGHFKSFVKGQLSINHEPNKLARANGELVLQKGQYIVYGKKLAIKKGRLLFSGNELYNPLLDITAEREVNIIQTRTSQLRLLDIASDQEIVDGVVGIHVGGLLDEPNISLYSDPWLPETERLSYLVLGVPSDNASSAQGQILTGAFQELADSLGFVQEESILGDVGSIAGLDNINLESSSELDRETGLIQQQTSVVIGKQLTDKLSLDYSVGLLDPTNVLHLRYRLNENWSVQTEADNQGQGGGDLIYSFER